MLSGRVRGEGASRIEAFRHAVFAAAVATLALTALPAPRADTRSLAERLGYPRGAILHAYDKMTGAEVGRIWMPAPQTGSPMTYAYQGKQYIVVAVSGGNYSGEYIAYRLPSGN